MILGVDEAGRGSLAGPVVVASVALSRGFPKELLVDSKALSHSRRSEIFEMLNQSESYTSIAVIPSQRIDEMNILQATLEGMVFVINPYLSQCSEVIIDGNQVPKGLPNFVRSEIKGDQRFPQVSAASIVAKVTRDHLMTGYEKILPGYDFNDHKGYGTQGHYEALFVKGLSFIHRRSFNLTQQCQLF